MGRAATGDAAGGSSWLAEALAGLAADYEAMTLDELESERLLVTREIEATPEQRRDLLAEHLKVLDTELASKRDGQGEQQ